MEWPFDEVRSKGKPVNLDDNILDAQLFSVKMVNGYFEDTVKFLNTGLTPQGYNIAQKNQLVVKEIDYQLIVG